MSLKAFHIVFIVLSAALSVGMGFWQIRSGGPMSFGLGIMFISIGVLLLVYGVRFLRKMKHLSIVWLVVAVSLLATQQVMACATCFGDPNSLGVVALKQGVWLLLGVTGGVLGSFAAFFIYLMKRSLQARVNP